MHYMHRECLCTNQSEWPNQAFDHSSLHEGCHLLFKHFSSLNAPSLPAMLRSVLKTWFTGTSNSDGRLTKNAYCLSHKQQNPWCSGTCKAAFATSNVPVHVSTISSFALQKCVIWSRTCFTGFCSRLYSTMLRNCQLFQSNAFPPKVGAEHRSKRFLPKLIISYLSVFPVLYLTYELRRRRFRPPKGSGYL